ncbi:hypothetical protein MY3296_009287 [Beauveria thailandica]
MPLVARDIATKGYPLLFIKGLKAARAA